MEAKIKALEEELSEGKQMHQDKEQEVGQVSTNYFISISIAISPTRLLCQTQASSFWAEFLRTIFKFRKRKKKFSCRLFGSSLKREIRNFPVVVVQWRQRNVQKKRDACAELLFCLFNLLLFVVLVVDCSSRRGVLKSLQPVKCEHNLNVSFRFFFCLFHRFLKWRPKLKP